MSKSNKFLYSSKEILMQFVDANITLFEIFDSRRIYRKPIEDYWQWRVNDNLKFSQRIHYLKKRKLVKIYQEGKEKYIELTPRGFKRLKKIAIDELRIKPPKKWDKKWRIVIFDIPDNKKAARNILREKLKNLGFIFLQESVFIFPFECKKEIDYICNSYSIRPFVKYILADIFEGDSDLIKKFLDLEVLEPEMIKK